MISLTAEYALRAVVWMAGHAEKAVGTREIAEATQVPVGYMSKVLQGLARTNVLRSRPGRTGGFVLGRQPDAMSVLDIVKAVDPIRRTERCPLGYRQHRGALCPLHRRLDLAVAMVERAFADCTIAELVAEARVQDGRCAGGAADPPGSAVVPFQCKRRRTSRGRRPRRPGHRNVRSSAGNPLGSRPE